MSDLSPSSALCHKFLTDRLSQNHSKAHCSAIWWLEALPVFSQTIYHTSISVLLSITLEGTIISWRPAYTVRQGQTPYLYLTLSWPCLKWYTSNGNFWQPALLAKSEVKYNRMGCLLLYVLFRLCAKRVCGPFLSCNSTYLARCVMWLRIGWSRRGLFHWAITTVNSQLGRLPHQCQPFISYFPTTVANLPSFNHKHIWLPGMIAQHAS